MSYRTFLVSLTIIVIIGAVIVFMANMNLNKEAEVCRLIANSLYSACEDYRLANGSPPTNLQSVLPNGHRIFEAVVNNAGLTGVRKYLSLSEDNRKFIYHGNDIGLANVFAMGMNGYDIYIDWHLNDFKVVYYYHPWDKE